MSETMVVRPVTLEGEVVRLEPLSFDHLDGLTEVGLGPDLWRWMPERIESRGQMRAFVGSALRAQGHGDQVPFASARSRRGPMRNHMITQGGRMRHAVYYSVIDSEWPAVRAALEARLRRAAVPHLRP